MFYIVYKVTNQLDGKYYIGSHKTKILDDGYMGSGKYLKRAQEKYGVENFNKEILFVFDNAEEMYKKEAELVNEDFLVTENTYNLKVGGFGGWDYINSTNQNLYGMNGQTGYGGENLRQSPWIRTDLTGDDRNSIKRKLSMLQHKRYENGVPNGFKGKHHTEETKRIIGSKSTINQAGSKNSQYGTCWVWCESVGNKKIHKDELNEYIQAGWIKAYKPGYKA
jgi:hypothetical protein